MNSIVLGVDIGGSHITACLVDLQNGKLIKSSLVRHAVNSLADKEVILTVWCNVITKAFGDLPLNGKRIGLAMPGPFDYENGISLIKDQAKFNSLYLSNIKLALAGRLGLAPKSINFINDAAAFLQGEVFCGAAKGYHNAIGITLGTGLGSAIAINGVAKDAALWNLSFLNGIAEDYLSTKWFVEEYYKLTGKYVTGVKELALLIENDIQAKQLFDVFGDNLGQFLSEVLSKYPSDVFVLGGNIAQAYQFFSSNLTLALKSNQIEVEIVISELNEHATLIGAASTFFNNMEISKV